jgi:endonuclease/exonuclease/phosphatase family metal-dependent hydrolase
MIRTMIRRCRLVDLETEDGVMDDVERSAQLRVMTLNLLSPDHGDWDRRRPVLQAGLGSLRPDVIALQETVWGNGYDQALDLLGPDYHVARHSGRSADGVGAVLGSRWPIGAIREIDLHVSDRVDLPWAAAVLVEIEAPPPVGSLLFVHYKSTYEVGYAYERELQAVTCARFVEAQLAGHNVHVVLAGDFDDTPDSASVRFWTGKQSLRRTSVAYRDAWAAIHPDDPGNTFTPINPLVRAGEMSLELGRRIDYIMVRCGVHGPTLDVVDCRLAFREPVDGVFASDHFGVVADLAVPAHPPGTWYSPR